MLLTERVVFNQKELYTKADLDWMNKKSRSSIEMGDKKIRLFATSGGSGLTKHSRRT